MSWGQENAKQNVTMISEDTNENNSIMVKLNTKKKKELEPEPERYVLW